MSRPFIKVGDTFKTIHNETVTIIENVGKGYHLAQFKDGTISMTNWCCLKKGYVKNVNRLSVFGIGIVGEGIYSKKNHKLAYDKWYCMLQRCYDESCRLYSITYADCTVDKHWHTFQNFAEDFYKFHGCKNKGWALDKDILFQGNRLYSNKTCCIVPVEINNITLRNNATRGDCMIGVHLKRGKYQAGIRMAGKNTYLGRFDSEIEAFLKYKEVKEWYIKERANFWKEHLDSKVYEALMQYKVNPDD